MKKTLLLTCMAAILSIASSAALSQENVVRFATSSTGVNISSGSIVGAVENVVENQSYGDWSEWTVLSTVSCTNQTPSTSTVNWGVSFDQTADCTQNLQRERAISDVYTDGSQVSVGIDTELSTATSSVVIIAIGTYDTVTSTYYGSWSSWRSWSACSSGTQSRYRTATKYFRWASGRTTSQANGVRNNGYRSC